MSNSTISGWTVCLVKKREKGNTKDSFGVIYIYIINILQNN